MVYDVIVGPIAQADISRNSSWWADNHSVQQALQWVDAVESQLATLDRDPERCGYASENEFFAYPLRQLLVGLGNQRSYRAVFTIKQNEVHVLTIRRAAQDTITATELPKSI